MLWTLHTPISEGVEKAEHKLHDFWIGGTADCPKNVRMSPEWKNVSAYS